MGNTADELLARRLAGILPHIDIAGFDFTIDWRLKELRETAAPHNRIDLERMELSDEGTEYLCLFHTGDHAVYYPAPGSSEIPAQVVFLRIPFELVLDPVGVAQAIGLPDTYLLKDYPIREHLAATVLPLAATNLPAIIEEDRNGKG